MSNFVMFTDAPKKVLLIEWGEDIGVVDLEARKLIAYGYDHLQVGLPEGTEVSRVHVQDYLSEEEDMQGTWDDVPGLILSRLEAANA